MKKSKTMVAAFLAASIWTTHAQADQPVNANDNSVASVFMQNPLAHKNNTSAHEFYLGSMILILMQDIHDDGLADVYFNEDGDVNTQKVISLLDHHHAYRAYLSLSALDVTMDHYQKRYGDRDSYYMAFCKKGPSKLYHQRLEDLMIDVFESNPFGESGLDRLINHVQTMQHTSMYLVMHVASSQARRNGMRPGLAVCNTPEPVLAEALRPSLQ